MSHDPPVTPDQQLIRVEIRRVRADGTIIHPRLRTPEQIAKMHDRAKVRLDAIVTDIKQVCGTYPHM